MPLGPGNPQGVGFDVTQRVLERESEAQRMCAPERSRVWKVGGRGGWGVSDRALPQLCQQFWLWVGCPI